jgi:hypothetical protein
MNLDIFGYIGAVIVAIYLIIHLILTTMLKKKLKPTGKDLILWFVVLVLMLVYAISRRDYPIIIFFAAVTLWAGLGLVDFSKKK